MLMCKKNLGLDYFDKILEVTRKMNGMTKNYRTSEVARKFRYRSFRLGRVYFGV